MGSSGSLSDSQAYIGEVPHLSSQPSSVLSNNAMPSKPADQSHQAATGLEDHFDLVCVGFGPASLAIAVALHDRGVKARVLFTERQRSFKWHAGMLLPNARMQISFMKDLATLRDPRSKFTFVNYLKYKNRLVAFTNLSIFLPLREEYNDYLTWCASHFEQHVRYGQETISVSPMKNSQGPIQSWRVVSQDVDTNDRSFITARHVVVAVGGKPKIPRGLSDGGLGSRIVHSSGYSTVVPTILADTDKAHDLAVIGGGQSSAEIFNDLQTRFPNARITLYTGASALKPSDDSPFVNEIFDPERVNSFYNLPHDSQQKTILSDKSTNYGVVRPELLDHIYESMYHQRFREPHQSKWRCKIEAWREVVGYDKLPDGRLQLRLKNTSSGEVSMSESSFDLAIVGTGYQRNVHETLLAPTRDLLPSDRFVVGRDYRLQFREDAVAGDSGIWLQGCCEDSHGLSDTLLSILAVRGGEMVDSIFPSLRQAKL